MAVVYENNCVGCGIPCINCGRKSERVIKCDAYGCTDYAEYHIDGEDLCEEHAQELLVEMFRELTIHEMAELLKVKISHCC